MHRWYQCLSWILLCDPPTPVRVCLCVFIDDVNFWLWCNAYDLLLGRLFATIVFHYVHRTKFVENLAATIQMSVELKDAIEADNLEASVTAISNP